MLEKIKDLVLKIKQEKPLILNISNEVSLDFIANGLLSLGASPIMSKAEEEMEDLVKISQVVVINPGTLNPAFVSLCKQACHFANQLNKPIILDPVGAGASRYRTETCKALLNEFDIAMIRGNASEIMALFNASQKTKGVESLLASEQAIDAAKNLSETYQAAIVISGKEDFIIDQDLMAKLDRGSPLMPSVTGTGCLLTAVIAAFHAVEKDRFTAAKIATLFYCLCGEIAAKKAEAPGSFKMHFIDALHTIPERV